MKEKEVFVALSAKSIDVPSPPPPLLQVLAGLSGLGGSHADVVLSVLRSRQLEVRRALLLRTDSISSTALHDFDWQLKVSQRLFSDTVQCAALCLFHWCQ